MHYSHALRRDKRKLQKKRKRKLQHLLDFRLLCASCFPFFVQECVKIFYFLACLSHRGMLVYGEKIACLFYQFHRSKVISTS